MSDKAWFTLTPALLLSLVACGQRGAPDSVAPTPRLAPAQVAVTSQSTMGHSVLTAQAVPGSAFAQRVFELTNAARAQGRTCGTTFYAAAPALAYGSQLEAAAQGHAADMATKNYFSHTSLDGRRFSDRITQAGYTWRTAGENIAAGYTTPEAVVSGWLQSPGHCANIMNPAFKDMGLGYAANTSSSYRHYWVQDFGAR